MSSDGDLLRWAILTGYAVVAAVILLIARRRRWLVAEPGVRPDVARMPTLAMLFFGLLAAQAIGTVAVRFLLGINEGPVDLRTHALALAGGHLAQIPLAIYTVRVLRSGMTSTNASKPLLADRALVAGFLAFLLIFPLTFACSAIAGELQATFISTPTSQAAHETLRKMQAAPNDPWNLLVIVGVLFAAPALEEIAYRGALQGALRAAGFAGWIAIVVTTAAFVLMHIPAIPAHGLAGALVGLTTLSLGLGLLRERTGGLVACFVIHALFNGTNLLLARIG